MNIHFMYDKKFAKYQIELFEKFYPGRSLYVMTRNVDISDLNNFNVIELERHTYDTLLERCGGKIENVFVYNASDSHCKIALYFKNKYHCRLYWMFFGSELYDNLYYRFNFPLIDNEKKSLSKYVLDKMRLLKHWPLFKRFAANVDYFCSWNKYDFELLKKYIDTPAKFKFYTHGSGLDVDENYVGSKDSKVFVQINHSASWDGNHITVLKKIAELDLDRNLELLLPLNYGDKSVVRRVEAFITEQKLNARVLKEFLPIDDYLTLLSRVNTAIYGQHRQEGGGNIIQAFRSGTKVFLREDNNLLHLYRDWGLKVFSFEKDLNSIDDILTPLPFEDQVINNYRIQINLSKEKVAESMIHFMD